MTRRPKFLPCLLVLMFVVTLPGRVVGAECVSPYSVRRGDTLYSIARNCGVSVEALLSANKLTSPEIRVGQSLDIPSTESPTVRRGPETEGGRIYVVRPGDNLYRIALKHGVTLSRLKAANGLRSNLIRVGHKLVIPASKKEPGVSAAKKRAETAVVKKPPETAVVKKPPETAAAKKPPETTVAKKAPAGTETARTSPVKAKAVPKEPAPSDRSGIEPLVLADYFVGYDRSLWKEGVTWDVPTVSYNSDHRGTMERQVGWARRAGLDGLVVRWHKPGTRTDNNMRALLDLLPEGFRSAIRVDTHSLADATQQTVADHLRYVLDQYGHHTSFLRIEGKPVFFFVDMEGVPRAEGTSALEAWRWIRDQVDQERGSVWIAEGTDPTYLDLFDGLHVYNVDRACCPGFYAKAPEWAGSVRRHVEESGQRRLWVGTIQPGWDDTRSAGPFDPSARSQAFARDRGRGSYYQATFDAVVDTNPDLLLVHSFNEWIDGSQIEPGSTYGNYYLNMTAKLVAQFKER